MQTAKDLDCKTFVLLGRDGGALKNCCDHQIIIPGETSDRIQEIHMMILHIIIECVDLKFYAFAKTHSMLLYPLFKVIEYFRVHIAEVYEIIFILPPFSFDGLWYT